jgi:hypothetical protein
LTVDRRLSTDFTLAGLTAIWSSVVEAMREQSRFLGEALATTEVVAVDPPDVTVSMREANPLFQESLEQKAPEVETLLAGMVGAPVNFRVRGPSRAAEGAPPVRMTEEAMRADRLKGLRRRDPALDVAADELDLEIVE